MNENHESFFIFYVVISCVYLIIIGCWLYKLDFDVKQLERKEKMLEDKLNILESKK